MNRKEPIESRITYKARVTLSVGVCFAIFVGVIFYLLPSFFGDSATHFVVAFILFAIALPLSIFLKIPRYIFNYSIIIPFAPVITVFLNEVAPRYVYAPSTQSYALSTAFVLFFESLVVFMVVSFIARFCIGYEVSSTYKPGIYSYKLNHDLLESLKRLKALLNLLRAESIITYKRKESRLMGFRIYDTRFMAYLHSKKEDSTEVGFIGFQLLHDTLFEPQEENQANFFVVFDAILKNWKKQGKIDGDTEAKPEFTNFAEEEFRKLYLSPTSFTFGRPHLSYQTIQEWTGKHTVFVGFLGGIIATIIAGLILYYLFGIGV